MPGNTFESPVDHVGVGIAALRDQADVFRHVGVRRARPLAIDDAVVVVGWFVSVRCMCRSRRGDTPMRLDICKFYCRIAGRRVQVIELEADGPWRPSSVDQVQPPRNHAFRASFRCVRSAIVGTNHQSACNRSRRDIQHRRSRDAARGRTCRCGRAATSCCAPAPASRPPGERHGGRDDFGPDRAAAGLRVVAGRSNGSGEPGRTPTSCARRR